MSNTQDKNRNTMQNILHNDPRVDFFDNQAPNWDTCGPDINVTLSRLRQIQNKLGLLPGMNILEVGCGTGQISGCLAEWVKPGKVVSIDFSPAMIQIASKKNIPAEFKVIDICGTVDMKERFDIVICFHSFPHFRDKIKALLNIRNLLKPDGMLIVLHLSGSKELNEFHKNLGGAVAGDFLPDAEEWEKLFKKIGFSLIEIEDKPDLFFLRGRLKRG